MKARWGSLMFGAGIVLALGGLAGTATGPRTVQATTTGCTISTDLYHCDVTGSGSTSYGFRVTNTATSGASRGITGIVNSNGAAYGVVGNATATSGATAGVFGQSSYTSGYGVYGNNVNTTLSANAYGVYGMPLMALAYRASVSMALVGAVITILTVME